MTNNTDPSTNPSHLLTESQQNIIAYNKVREDYRQKNREFGVELWSEITAVGKGLLTKVRDFLEQK